MHTGCKCAGTASMLLVHQLYCLVDTVETSGYYLRAHMRAHWCILQRLALRLHQVAVCFVCLAASPASIPPSTVQELPVTG